MIAGGEGPLVVPVHNMGAGGNTPPFWLPGPRGLGWPHVLFNAFFLRPGRHSPPEGVAAWVDSGGFLFLDAPQRRLAGLHGRERRGNGYGCPGDGGGWSERLALEVLERQKRFGALVGFTLDHPLPGRSQVEPECCPRLVAERLHRTAVGAAVMYQARGSGGPRLLVVLQYNGVEALRRLLHLLRGELRSRAGMDLGDVDGYAVGGLVPHSGKWWLLARRLQELRRVLGWEPWVHVLGVASPHNLALLYYAGADSMDSKTYIIAAAKRLYYNPPGARPARLHLPSLPEEAALLNAATGETQYARELRGSTRLLALHNLAVTLRAAEEAREAQREGRLGRLLVERGRDNPRLAKALREVREPRPARRE